MIPQRDWFTLAEVARDLGVPLRTLYKWVNAGRVDIELAGKGTYLVHKSEIEAMQRNGNRPVAPRQLASA